MKIIKALPTPRQSSLNKTKERKYRPSRPRKYSPCYADTESSLFFVRRPHTRPYVGHEGLVRAWAMLERRGRRLERNVGVGVGVLDENER